MGTVISFTGSFPAPRYQTGSTDRNLSDDDGAHDSCRFLGRSGNRHRCEWCSTAPAKRATQVAGFSAL